MRRYIWICAVAMSGTWGCAARQAVDMANPHPVGFAAQSAEADTLWQATQDTLRDFGYRLDRVDRRGGVITTLPEVSEHFFEVWRKDVATRADWKEATVNDIRRWMQVTLAGESADRWSTIEVVVHKQRFSGPDRQFNNSGAALQFFGSQLPATTGAVRVRPQDEQWLDMGDDPAMANRVLAAILAGAGMPPVAASSDAAPPSPTQ